MLKKFTTNEIVFISILGALVFAIDLIFVVGLEAAIGIPGVGVLIDTLVIVGIATAGGMIVKKFGVYTIWSLIYSVLATPTNIIGPPGAYKIIIGLLLGLFADLILLLFRYKKKGYYFALPIANVLVIPVLLFALITLGLPGVEELKSAIWIFIPVILIEGLIGAWLGIWFYEKKLKNKKIVQQISG